MSFNDLFHNDFHQDNIIVKPNGIPQIIDFEYLDSSRKKVTHYQEGLATLDFSSRNSDWTRIGDFLSEMRSSWKNTLAEKFEFKLEEIQEFQEFQTLIEAHQRHPEQESEAEIKKKALNLVKKYPPQNHERFPKELNKKIQKVIQWEGFQHLIEEVAPLLPLTQQQRLFPSYQPPTTTPPPVIIPEKQTTKNTTPPFTLY